MLVLNAAVEPCVETGPDGYGLPLPLISKSLLMGMRWKCATASQGQTCLCDAKSRPRHSSKVIPTQGKKCQGMWLARYGVKAMAESRWLSWAKRAKHDPWFLLAMTAMTVQRSEDQWRSQQDASGHVPKAGRHLMLSWHMTIMILPCSNIID